MDKLPASVGTLLIVGTVGLPKSLKGYGDGVSIVPAQLRALHTSRVMSTERKEGQSEFRFEDLPEEKLGYNPKTGKYTGVYKRMIQVRSLLIAYEAVSGKSGANTKSVTDETLDFYSRDAALQTYHELKDHSFKFKPIRRVYIPKKDGKLRPLGIPSPRDKVVQRAAATVLEEIYEGKGGFLSCSHGFRPSKSTHTALKEVQR